MAADGMTLHKKLIDMQQRLKVPKGRDNGFGGFAYRNIEDIEDKAKPLLAEHELTLTFEDEVVEVGGRVYVKASAVLSDGTAEIRKSAYAREATTPKAKTDDAQLTGSCSSYARKYAASGMFLIDNTKDADSMDNSSKPTKTPPKVSTPSAGDKVMATMDPPTGKQVITIRGLLHQLDVEKDIRDKIVGQATTAAKASDVISELMKKVEHKKAEASDGQV